MTIRFTKSSGHFGEFDLDYICIESEGITVQQWEESFQSFLKASGFIIDEMPKPQVNINEIGIIEEDE